MARKVLTMHGGFHHKSKHLKTVHKKEGRPGTKLPFRVKRQRSRNTSRSCSPMMNCQVNVSGSRNSVRRERRRSHHGIKIVYGMYLQQTEEVADIEKPYQTKSWFEGQHRGINCSTKTGCGNQSNTGQDRPHLTHQTSETRSITLDQTLKLPGLC